MHMCTCSLPPTPPPSRPANVLQPALASNHVGWKAWFTIGKATQWTIGTWRDAACAGKENYFKDNESICSCVGFAAPAHTLILRVPKAGQPSRLYTRPRFHRSERLQLPHASMA
eukprot:jgi/Botrbrau1/18634/Bobra.0367s0070.1